MSDQSKRIRATRIAGLMSCVLAAGCTGLERSPPQPAQPATEAVSVAPAVPADVPATQPVAAPREALEADVTPPPSAATPPPVSSTPAAPSTAPGAADRNPSITPAKPPARITAAPAPATPVPKVATKKAAPKPPAPPLDLASLEARLRDTKAIGVLTKISLKNQVDDLLDKFRAYYNRQAKVTLAELRQPYDMLLLKVLSLLQDSDPPLARDIVASREAIWDILASPEKFNQANLMAGEVR